METKIYEIFTNTKKITIFAKIFKAMSCQPFFGETNNHRPALIVMLTHNDFTVMDAAEIFERCKDSRAKCWGSRSIHCRCRR